jgi:putative membrane protein
MRNQQESERWVDENISKLNGLKGAVDKAYVDNEVTYHQVVIDALDKTLLPNAKNAELKGLLDTPSTFNHR